MEAFQSGASTSRPRDSSRDGAPVVVEARCKRLPLETRQSLVVAGSVRAWFGALAALTETGGGAHLESMSCDSPQKSTRSASLRSFTWCDSGMIAIGRAAARVAHRARWRRVCATRLMTEAEGRESWSPGARVEVRVARVKDIPLRTVRRRPRGASRPAPARRNPPGGRSSHSSSHHHQTTAREESFRAFFAGAKGFFYDILSKVGPIPI